MTKYTTSYMDNALFDLPAVLERAKADLADVEFDTIVGTGFSGGVVIPALALTLGKKFVLIRKETDDSHHGSGRLLGELGRHWIFVDDFISSGRTRLRVAEKIAMACVAEGHSVDFVGQYMYVNFTDEGPHFQPFEADWLSTGSF